MYEIEKLRKRLKNIGKHTTEYRMTVTEAIALVAEFDSLKKQQEKPQTEVVLNEPVVTTRIIDGGAL
jgi:hypothetical protein